MQLNTFKLKKKKTNSKTTQKNPTEQTIAD